MGLYYLVTAWIVLFTAVIVRGSTDSVDKYDENSVTSEVVALLNATYFNINEKVCELQRRVDAIEGGTHSGQQCECNSTEIQEFKRTVSTKINDFSKILSGFENALRTMKQEQEELREQLGGEAGVASTPTTTTTTPPPPTTPTTTTSKSRDCKDGWIESPEKCYYVSTRSEATEWATAINRYKSIGANLVEIKTDKEGLFIAHNLPSRVGGNDLFYTGRERKRTYDWFFISNNERVDTSVRSWAVREPSNTDSQTCGCTKSEHNFKMHDCVCMGFSVLYICEVMRPFTGMIPIHYMSTYRYYGNSDNNQPGKHHPRYSKGSDHLRSLHPWTIS